MFEFWCIVEMIQPLDDVWGNLRFVFVVEKRKTNSSKRKWVELMTMKIDQIATSWIKDARQCIDKCTTRQNIMFGWDKRRHSILISTSSKVWLTLFPSINSMKINRCLLLIIRYGRKFLIFISTDGNQSTFWINRT